MLHKMNVSTLERVHNSIIVLNTKVYNKSIIEILGHRTFRRYTAKTLFNQYFCLVFNRNIETLLKSVTN